MKILFVCLFILTISFSYAFFKKEEVLELSNLSYSLYDYEAISIDGDIVKLSDYKGKKIIIVNVASKCGYTYQYEGLQSLYSKYKDDVVVLGFPANDFLWQEPGKNSDIKKFCTTKYGISFNLAEKSIVKKKKHQNSIYTWLSNKALNGWNDKAPSWNFCKYLIDEKGNLIYFYPSSIKPLSKEILDFINNE